MQLTREADYGLRIMLEIATQPFGAITTTKQVSRRRIVPLPFVRKIVPRLSAAGLLRTRRGKSGGMMLARRPDQISLLEVIDAMSRNTLTVNRCLLLPKICPLRPTCPVHEVCRLARDEMMRLFGSVRLSDMVARAAELKTMRAALARAGQLRTALPRTTSSNADGLPPAQQRRSSRVGAQDPTTPVGGPD
ncbi:MAG: hypothetical protein A3H36_09125 [Chloroflexi bacterium RIFCSPLOWO2_02_FULL_71_16]|nr:MAG: hypothetical protein A3H36_09125 [Chloroflexi bacterium RIFCSPLOWO2_02_FULL_71_16]